MTSKFTSILMRGDFRKHSYKEEGRRERRKRRDRCDRWERRRERTHRRVTRRRERRTEGRERVAKTTHSFDQSRHYPYVTKLCPFQIEVLTSS